MFRGKTAIITGSNRGIGKALLEAFAKEGVNIFACARQQNDAFEEELKQTADKNNVWIKPMYFDLSD